MPLRSLNDYDALDSADATDADLHVENGLITDGNGNTVEIGDIQTGAVSWGNRDEGVDRVKDATPTGNLEVRNQAPYVDGYGEVELTNSAHRRTITQIGNTDGNDGDLRTDANGSLTIRFEGTVSKSDSNTATTTYSTTGTNVLYATFPRSRGQSQVSVQAAERTSTSAKITPALSKPAHRGGRAIRIVSTPRYRHSSSPPAPTPQGTRATK
ncbi:hypothetical protein ACFQL0_22015 [Haloplanus litoreus]|uniref:hypothetical protein n=1 Tax=Haloplanus litoreus TaxID=767515 RepID=UPI00360FFD0D